MRTAIDMTGGRPFPIIVRFTLPLLMGIILQQAYSLIDAIIVGKYLGMNALAAVGAGSSFIFLILGFCNGCCCGFGIPVAHKFGARDFTAMRRYVAVGIHLSVIISIAVAFVTGLSCNAVLDVMSTPKEIRGEAYDYLLVTFIGVPCTFFYNLFSSIIRALGDSSTPFWFLLLAAVLNVVLDLLCILILGWGVTGAAVATVFSQGFSAALCYLYIQRRFEILKSRKSESGFDATLAKKLLRIGIPMGLQLSVAAIGSIMLQSANNALGTVYVAAFTAALRIEMLFYCPFESIGMAMATYCGQNFGAGDIRRILSGIKSATVLMLIFAICANVILWTGAEWLSDMFVNGSDTEVAAYSATFLHVAVTFFPIVGMMCILRYSIQGVGYSSIALLSGCAETASQAVMSLWLIPVYGFIAVCFGGPAAWIAAVLTLIPSAIHVLRKVRSMEGSQQEPAPSHH